MSVKSFIGLIWLIFTVLKMQGKGKQEHSTDSYLVPEFSSWGYLVKKAIRHITDWFVVHIRSLSSLVADKMTKAFNNISD